MRDNNLTVVPIFTSSYAGATWISNLITAHPDAFNLGPGHLSVERSKEELKFACQWHRDECPLYTKFADIYDPSKNFFTQMAAFSGKKLLVVYNPRPPLVQSQIDSSLFRVQPLKLVRDGRALVVSTLKHVGDKFNNFYDVCRAHLRPSFRRIEERKVAGSEPDLLVRYEDFIMDGRAMLKKFGEQVGLQYDDRAFRYWDFDRHPTGGNLASNKLMKALHDAEAARDYKSAFYQKAYEQLAKNPDKPIMDDRWKALIGERDRFIYDYFIGSFHERFGYERDVFSPEVRDKYMKELGLPKDPAKAPETLPPEIVSKIAWSEAQRESISQAE